MTVPGLNGGLPDISGNAVVAGAAISTIAVYVATLFGLNPPPEVSSAFTTLIALGLGLLRGDGFGTHSRRAGDTPQKGNGNA